MDNFLFAFLLAVSISIALNLVLKRFEIPTIIGYIITGTVISEFFNLKAGDELSHIAEFGIVFLMFTIGLEFSFKHLMSMKTAVFINGGFQMTITGILLAFFTYFFLDLPKNTAMIIGLALALSSTAIVLKMLNDSGDISQKYGRKSLGILIFQDIAVIPILIMIDVLASNDASLKELLIKAGISAVVLIISLYFIAKYIVSPVMTRVLSSNSDEIFMGTVFFIIIGASSLAHYLGFSFSLGAFLAGMMLAETDYRHKIEANLIPFRDILLGVFFITIGMQISVISVIKNIHYVLAVAIIVMVVKALIVFVIVRVKNTTRVSFKTGITVSQVGEFALAVFGLVVSREILDAKTAQILIASSVLSMFATPFILRKLDKLADLVQKEIEISVSHKIEESPQNLGLKNHVVIFGYGSLGRETVSKIKEKGIEYIAIDSEQALIEKGKEAGDNVILGSAFQPYTFDYACVKDASLVLVTVSNEQKLEIIAKTISSYDNLVRTVMVVNERELKEGLFDDLGNNFYFVRQESVIADILVQNATCSPIDKEEHVLS